nr:immunoglobulin light chain junction region [Macaca mulatta]
DYFCQVWDNSNQHYIF